MLYKILIAVMLVLHPVIARSEPSGPMGGVYLDSFAGLSGRAGYAWVVHTQQKREFDEHETSYFVYPDVEVGTEAQKIGLGVGAIHFALVGRVGLTYVKKRSRYCQGVDLAVSVMGASLKLGFYNERDADHSVFTVGLGVGL